MKGLKVLFIAFFFLFSSSLADGSYSNEPFDLDNFRSMEGKAFAQFQQAMVILRHEPDKLKVLSTLLELCSKESYVGNITLVGSQNVYNEDGTIKEVRTVELAIPQIIPQTQNKYASMQLGNIYAGDYTSNYEKIKEVKEVTDSLSLLGWNSEVIWFGYDEDGDAESGVYINKDTVATKYNGFSDVNTTIEVANRQVVEESLKNLKQGVIPVSTLNFDKDGNFVKDGSTVVAEQLASTADSWGDPSPETIQTVLEGVAQVSLETKSRDQVPNKLQAYLEEKSPNTTFIVTASEPFHNYINKDFSLRVSYDLVDPTDYVSYTIFGYTPADS